jgi:hypothetical protein
MLNPDGVIYGNYRCSLLGVDLNRRWDSPSRYMHPTIYHAKRFIQCFSESHEIGLYCDMHGHSMRKNVFMYACSTAQSHSDVLIRLIPRLLGRLNPVFSFTDCHFRIERCKLATARVVAFRELNILNSYTLEASFYGPETKRQLGEEGDGDSHMGTEHMEALGRDLCRVMSDFVSRKSFKRKLMEAANKPLSPEPPLAQAEPSPPSPHLTLFSSQNSGREPDNDEDFWAKVSEFETKAYQVLYAQHIPQPKASEPEEAKLDMQTAIQAIAEAGDMPEELVKTDIGSDEGGSDSLGSDNDDSKQAFIYSKSKPRKAVRRSRRYPVPRSKSCVRPSKPEARPKTPFVFGNYPGSRPPTRLSRFGKDLSVESPNAVRMSSDSAQPVKVLLTGFKRTRIGKMSRPARISYCPSAANLNESRESDSVLRAGPSRWLERASLKLKARPKQATVSPD